MVATTPKPALMSYAQVFELADELTVEQAFDRLLPLPLLPVFGRLWGGYARAAFARLPGLLGTAG